MSKFKNIFKALIIFSCLSLISPAAFSEQANGKISQNGDSTITTKAMMQLASTQNVPSRDIAVNTYRGKVQISGFVADNSQKKLAEITVRQIKGVRGVINNLVMQPSPDLSTTAKAKQYAADTATTAKIKTDLIRDPNVSANDVSVITSYGVTQVSGFVGSPQAANAVKKIAITVASKNGAKKVIDSLIVVGNSTPIKK